MSDWPKEPDLSGWDSLRGPVAWAYNILHEEGADDDNLRDRIAAALVQALRSQAELGGFLEYEPCDDDGNPCGGTLLRIDARIVADAVIRELGLTNG